MQGAASELLCSHLLYGLPAGPISTSTLQDRLGRPLTTGGAGFRDCRILSATLEATQVSAGCRGVGSHHAEITDGACRSREAGVEEFLDDPGSHRRARRPEHHPDDPFVPVDRRDGHVEPRGADVPGLRCLNAGIVLHKLVGVLERSTVDLDSRSSEEVSVSRVIAQDRQHEHGHVACVGHLAVIMQAAGISEARAAHPKT